MTADRVPKPGTRALSEPDIDTDGLAAAVVRVRCVNGELSRAIIGYGRNSEEAYGSAISEARAFCRDFGGVEKITKL